MKKILIIDDEPSITEIIALYAERLGYASDKAASGDEAVELLQHNNYWAVFCDYLMPGLGGLEIYAKLCDMHNGQYRNFVLLTGTVLDDHVLSVTDRQKIVVFHKPFNFEGIKSTISQLEAPA